ncbi:MAG: S-layer homology domain-containing protein [Candidatus Gracilibacteria bacterium]|jgi:hypothetical protein|nr:S-layer homology domain-containing protein [Candidatus Gracilibacteria bacterium]
MKKILVTTVILSLFSFFPILSNADTLRDIMEDTYSANILEFSDIPSSHINYKAMAFLFEEEVINGYSDGTFKPDGLINRAELMKMISAIMYRGEMDSNMASYKNCFSDVKEEWFATYVCFGKEKGFVNGYGDGTFRPSNNVTRAEAMKIILNVMIEEALWPTPTEAEMAFTLPKDSEPNAWYEGFLRFAIAKELLDGQHVTGTEAEYYYKPNEAMTRKEVAEMIWRTFLYMMERVEYVEMLTMTSCFQIANSDLSEEEAKQKWIDELLTPYGITEAEADELSEKYINDDVLSAMKADGIEYECGDKDSVDMSKWSGFLKYGR